MSSRKEFRSALAVYLEGLVQEKQSMGFTYNTERETLLRLDQYFIDNSVNTPYLTKQMLNEWCRQNETEKCHGHIKRIAAVRQLSLYLNCLGISAYYPRVTIKSEITLPHILNEDERKAFFAELDQNEPLVPVKSFVRLTYEYRVLFRLLYCCGLRNSEAANLPVKDIDFDTGILTIHSKQNKTRLVYMSGDLTELCSRYFKYLCAELGCVPKCFFPSQNPDKHLPNTSVCAQFQRIWKRTCYASTCNNVPTPHDLRFTFITDRINEWELAGIDVNTMMPYLSQYVGHSDIQDTYYYYHISTGLFQSIRKKDRTSSKVLPEVDYEHQ